MQVFPKIVANGAVSLAPQEWREFCLSAPGAGNCAISGMQVEESFLGKGKFTRHIKNNVFCKNY